MSKRRISTAALAIAFVAFLIHIIVSANSGEPLIWFDLVKAIPMGDKIGHLALFAILTWLLDAGAFRGRRGKLRSICILLSALTASVLATIEEISQIWITNRTFDLGDLSASLIGIALAGLFISRSLNLNLKTPSDVDKGE